MVRKLKLMPNERNLIKRYLVWCYKTTKEELDRVDRYFTQGIVDEFILNELSNAKEFITAQNTQYRQLVDEFKAYMDKKLSNAINKKYLDKRKTKNVPEYQYLSNRMAAIEKAISFHFGENGLKEIIALYENEMTGRILSSREHD